MLKANPSTPPEPRWAKPAEPRNPRYSINSNARRLSKETQKRRFVQNQNKQQKNLAKRVTTRQTERSWIARPAQAMLPQSMLPPTDENSILLLDQRIKELDNCFSSKEIPEENEWQNLPRLCTRHEVAEAKRLAKLINPERWREIFLGYCSALLSLRSARPKRWAQRDDELVPKWWYAPWYSIDSSEPIRYLGQALRLGFENLIAPEHIERQRSLLKLDLGHPKLGSLNAPETISQLLMSVGTQFNEGCLGYFTQRSAECPKEVYALLKLFLRRCSDKGVIFDAGNLCDSRRASIEDFSTRMARGNMFAWPEFQTQVECATRTELAEPLYQALKALEKAPRNVPACATVCETEEAHVGLSVFSAFMLPICPIINANTQIDPQSQSANILKVLNEQWSKRTALSTPQVHGIKHNNPHVFAAVKVAQSDSEGDLLMLANFANHEAQVELPLRHKKVLTAQNILAGPREQALTDCKVEWSPKARPTFLVPPRGVVIADLLPRV